MKLEQKIIRLQSVILEYSGDEKGLQGLKNDLQILKNKLEDREGNREITQRLGYSRIGRNNV